MDAKGTKGIGVVATVALILLAAPAMAEPRHTWSDMFVYPPALLRLIVSAILCYLVALGITGLFSARGYPPTVARVGCWLGAALWTVWILFGILEAILRIYPPLYVLLLIMCVVILFGVILGATRPRAVH